MAARQVSASQAHRLQTELNLLTQLPRNKRCADCNVELSAGASWADALHGVFICKACSGAHRALGPHDATVKSVGLDTWTEELVTMMRVNGNAHVNRVHEKYVPPGLRKPDAMSPATAREQWVRAKYVLRMFSLPPPSDARGMAVSPHGTTMRNLGLQLAKGAKAQGAGGGSNADGAAAADRLVEHFAVVGVDFSDATQVRVGDRGSGSGSAVGDGGTSFPAPLRMRPKVLDSFPQERAHQLPQHIGMFCFPSYNDSGGVVLRHSPPPPSLHAFALTDVAGNRLYGSALIVHEQLSSDETAELIQLGYTAGHAASTSQSGASNTHADDGAAGTVTGPSGSQLRRKLSAPSLWQPVALVLLQRLPLLTLQRRFLCQLYRASLSSAPLPLERYIANIVCEAPLPPSGEVRVLVSLPEAACAVWRPPDNRLPLADFSYAALFGAVPAQVVLTAFALLLAERKLAIISASTALLLPATEALLSLLAPFRWQGIYIPVCPVAIATELMHAPVPFVVGLDASYIERTPPNQRPTDVAFLDLDKGVLLQPSAVGAVAPAYSEVGDPEREVRASFLPEREATKLRAALATHVYTKLLQYTTEFHHARGGRPPPPNNRVAKRQSMRPVADASAGVASFLACADHAFPNGMPPILHWAAEDGGTGAHADSVQQEPHVLEPFAVGGMNTGGSTQRAQSSATLSATGSSSAVLQAANTAGQHSGTGANGIVHGGEVDAFSASGGPGGGGSGGTLKGPGRRGSGMATADGPNDQFVAGELGMEVGAVRAAFLRFFVSLLRMYRRFISVPQSRAEKEREQAKVAAASAEKEAKQASSKLQSLLRAAPSEAVTAPLESVNGNGVEEVLTGACMSKPTGVGEADVVAPIEAPPCRPHPDAISNAAHDVDVGGDLSDGSDAEDEILDFDRAAFLESTKLGAGSDEAWLVDAFVRSQMFEAFLEEAALGAPNAVFFDEHIVAKLQRGRFTKVGLRAGMGKATSSVLGRLKRNKGGSRAASSGGNPQVEQPTSTGLGASSNTPFLDEDRDPTETFFAPQPSGRGLPVGRTFGPFPARFPRQLDAELVGELRNPRRLLPKALAHANTGGAATRDVMDLRLQRRERRFYRQYFARAEKQQRTTRHNADVAYLSQTLGVPRERAETALGASNDVRHDAAEWLLHADRAKAADPMGDTASLDDTADHAALPMRKDSVGCVSANQLDTERRFRAVNRAVSAAQARFRGATTRSTLALQRLAAVIPHAVLLQATWRAYTTRQRTATARKRWLRGLHIALARAWDSAGECLLYRSYFWDEFVAEGSSAYDTTSMLQQAGPEDRALYALLSLQRPRRGSGSGTPGAGADDAALSQRASREIVAMPSAMMVSRAALPQFLKLAILRDEMMRITATAQRENGGNGVAVTTAQPRTRTRGRSAAAATVWQARDRADVARFLNAVLPLCSVSAGAAVAADSPIEVTLPTGPHTIAEASEDDEVLPVATIEDAKKVPRRRLSSAAKRVSGMGVGALPTMEVDPECEGVIVDEGDLELVVTEERGALYGGLQRCNEAVKDAMYLAFGLATAGKKKKRTLADTLWRLPAAVPPQNPMHEIAMDTRRGSIEAEDAELEDTAKLLAIVAASARAVLLLEPWVREQAEGLWG